MPRGEGHELTASIVEMEEEGEWVGLWGGEWKEWRASARVGDMVGGMWGKSGMRAGR
jgi:hypothetical protein